MSKRKWVAQNVDVVVLCIIGVGLGAIAITGFIALALVLATDGNWRGDFAWTSTKLAFWSAVQFCIASMIWDNRRLRADNRVLTQQVRLLRFRGAA